MYSNNNKTKMKCLINFKYISPSTSIPEENSQQAIKVRPFFIEPDCGIVHTVYTSLQYTKTHNSSVVTKNNIYVYIEKDCSEFQILQTFRAKIGSHSTLPLFQAPVGIQSVGKMDSLCTTHKPGSTYPHQKTGQATTPNLHHQPTC